MKHYDEAEFEEALRDPETWCCWRPPVPASINLKTMSTVAAPSALSWSGLPLLPLPAWSAADGKTRQR